MLAYEFAPYHRPGSTIGAQRPFQFAKHLPSFGWRSIVLCSDFKTRCTLAEKSDWKKQVDELVATSLASHSEKDTLVIPLPSLTHAGFFDKLWHRAVVMDKLRGTFSPRGGLLNRIIRPLATFFKLFMGDHSQSWQPVALYASELVLKKVKADMILAEHSPDASVFVASKLNRRNRLPWIIDFRDPIVRDMNPTARMLYKRFTVPRFKNVFGTINVNEYWVSHDAQMFRKRTCKILNGFDPEEFHGVNTISSTVNVLRIGYFGSIQYGQNINVFLKAIKQLPEWINVEFIYRGNLYKWVSQFFVDYSKQNLKIDSSDSVTRDESIRLMASCDVLLLLSLKNERDIYLSKGVVPGKTFEYFALKKPILLSTGDQGLLDDLVMQSGAGVIGNDAESIVKLLVSAVDQKRHQKTIWDVKYNDDFIRSFTREKQAGSLAEFMDSILKEVR